MRGDGAQGEERRLISNGEMIMFDATLTVDSREIANRYLAIWNERDAARRRELIVASFTDDAIYIDPVMQGDGHAGLAAMIDAALAQFPGHHFVLRGDPEGHNDRVRFSWSLLEGGMEPQSEAGTARAAVAHGTDVVIVAEDGRMRRVTGLLDAAPAGPAADTVVPAAGAAGWTAKDFARFWANPDPDRIGTGVAHDAVAYWPGRETPIRGAEGYVRPLRAILERLPDLRLEVAEHASNDDTVFIRWIARATDAGRPLEFTGVDIVRHRNGEVVGNRIFCDHPLIREAALG
jgi:ketosteroid isomerase-like protein